MARFWGGIAILITVRIMVWPSMQPPRAENSPQIRKQSFGKQSDGKEADLYILTNKNGITHVTTLYGQSSFRRQTNGYIKARLRHFLSTDEKAATVIDRRYTGRTRVMGQAGG